MTISTTYELKELIKKVVPASKVESIYIQFLEDAFNDRDYFCWEIQELKEEIARKETEENGSYN